uniref:Uncharacterized protein n=1 Tax=Phytophthora ramorum TaxID=164328 RepID=H3H207_PHYRM
MGVALQAGAAVRMATVQLPAKAAAKAAVRMATVQLPAKAAAKAAATMPPRSTTSLVSANLLAPTAGEPLGTASLRALHKFVAQHIFQTELDQLRDSAQSALAAQPAMPGQFPPARFDAPSSVRIPDVKFVGVPATAQDILEDSFTCDGFGGLEALIGVEGLSEAQVREIVQRVAPDAQVDRDFLVPQDSDWTPEEFRTLLESPGAKRELASLVRLYGSQDLARRIFWMVTMFRRALDRLDRAEAQLKSDGKTTSQQLLNADSELREVKRQFGLQHGEHETLGVVIPIGLIRFGDVSFDTSHDSLDRPFLQAISLGAVRQSGTLFAAQKLSEPREDLAHETWVLVVAKHWRCSKTPEHPLFVGLSNILSRCGRHRLAHDVSRESILKQEEENISSR